MAAPENVEECKGFEPLLAELPFPMEDLISFASSVSEELNLCSGELLRGRFNMNSAEEDPFITIVLGLSGASSFEIMRCFP